MDYLLITEEKIEKRYNTLPEKIMDVLDSESNLENLRNICKKHFLDEEKTLIIEQLVGLVILGFVSIDEFSNEISSNIHIVNPKHAKEIVNEIISKILEPHINEIRENYQAPTAMTDIIRPETFETPDLSYKPETEEIEIKSGGELSPELKEGEISQKFVELKEKLNGSPSTPPPVGGVAQEISFESQIISSEPVEEVPFIIHKEAELPSASAGAKKSFGGIFGFLKKKPEGTDNFGKNQTPVSAEIQIGPERESDKPFSGILEQEIKPTTSEVAQSNELINVIASDQGERGNLKNEIALAEPHDDLVKEPKMRVVHYSDFRTPTTETFGGISKPEEIKDKGEETDKKEIQPSDFRSPEAQKPSIFAAVGEPRLEWGTSEVGEIKPEQKDSSVASLPQNDGQNKISFKESEIVSIDSLAPPVRQSESVGGSLIEGLKPGEQIPTVKQKDSSVASLPQNDGDVGLEPKKTIDVSAINLKDLPVVEEDIIDLRKLTNE